ncbi:MAG: Cys-tRNA(Pro) deacylase [Clostridiales bacterium]|nr:Cys-tRNA(Pro) deacylase [Clostridiales bacterium]
MTKGKFLSEKTNVMRILDKNKIPYKSRFYENTGAVSGMEVAEVLGQDPSEVFKTLVTVGTSGNYYVFIVPVSRELNLKKAASFVGEKSVSMIKSKELLPLTGYIHGGCSPVGMKKLFRTVMDSSAKEKNTVMVSGGKIGCQIEISPADLAKVVPFDFSDIT